MVALTLHSIRTVPTECDNFENLKGEHLGDGLLNVYPGGQLTVQGGGGAYEDVFPLLDWHLSNGVTCEADAPLLYCGPETGDIYKARRTAFVSCVSDGQLGQATMDTATHNLTGHRSKVFLPQRMLALMSNLTDPTPAEVRTTLHSRVIATKGVGGRGGVRGGRGSGGRCGRGCQGRQLRQHRPPQSHGDEADGNDLGVQGRRMGYAGDRGAGSVHVGRGRGGIHRVGDNAVGGHNNGGGDGQQSGRG